MTAARILVAGVGNIFLGDDGFGVEVVRRLARRPLPEGVRVLDFGIRGLDLAYALLDGYDTVILVDAAPRGGQVGSLYVLEPEIPTAADRGDTGLLADTHNLDPVKVLRLVAALGGQVGKLLVVGCEPAPAGDLNEMLEGLSDPVRAAVDEAVPLIESLLVRLPEERAQTVTAGAVAR
jgi:hydrogenase maturation protease